MASDDLGDRMKRNYENVYKVSLPYRLPAIIRLDGKAFHTFTRGMDKPFDNTFIQCMMKTSIALCQEIPTTVLAYCQSDEISLLLHSYKKYTSQPWLANEIQKIVSISAGIASAVMSLEYGTRVLFDARVFVIPEAEAANYFIWRQQDATRNSISSYAHSLYSHKELMRKNSKEQQEMIFDKGINWNECETHLRRGFCVKKDSTWEIDLDIPKFSEDRFYIEQHLKYEK